VASVSDNRIAGILTEEASSIRKNWGWLLAFSIIQIVVGMLAVSFAFSSTMASVLVLGILFLVAAGVQLAAAIWAREWSGSMLFILLGVLYAIAGVLTLQHPVQAAEGFTLMLAAAFLVGGMFRIVASLVEQFPGWGWVLCNGIITLLLGVLIWQQWPESGLWVVGMFVGIDLIVNGMTWAALAVVVRNAVTPFAAQRA
jgi:uncharacterized membrane protein HdeD (DUF308 family)